MPCVGNQYGGFEQTLFLGCSVVSFTSTVGWNEQVTEVTVELIEDPCPGEKYYWNSKLEKTLWTDPDLEFLGLSQPIVGVPAYFRLGNFEFCGLIQSWEKSDNNSGTRYIVKLVSPVKILEDTKLIIGEYAGPILPENTNFTLFPSVKPYNIFNVFGYAENINGISCPLLYQSNIGVYSQSPGALGSLDGSVFGTPAGGFGGSLTNKNGMPWNMIKDVLNVLINKKIKSENDFSPYGRILHKGVNYSAGHGILGKDVSHIIVDGFQPTVTPQDLSEYFVDLSELPRVENYYRFNQSEITILEAITKVCQDTGYDFFIELLPVRYSEESDDIAKIIKIRTISRRSQPAPGQIDIFVQQALANEILVSSSVGREFRNDTTSKVLIGGKKQTVYQAYQSDNPNNSDDQPTPVEADDMILPFFGTYPNGDMIVPYKDADGFWEFKVPSEQIETSLTYTTANGKYITINERELLASSDMSLWTTYIEEQKTDTYYITTSIFSNPYITGVVLSGLNVPPDSWARSIQYKQKPRLSAYAAFFPEEKEELLKNHATYIAKKRNNSIKAARDLQVLQQGIGSLVLNNQIEELEKQDTSVLYQFINSFATQYYGKKFAVRVPYSCAKIDSESNQITYSEQPTQDGGWTEMPYVLDLPLTGAEIDVFRNETNKIQTIVAFTGYQFLDTSDINFEDFVSYNNNLYIKGNVDSEYVFHNVATQQYPRAVIDIPSPIVLSSGEDPGIGLINGILKVINNVNLTGVIYTDGFRKKNYVGNSYFYTWEPTNPIPEKQYIISGIYAAYDNAGNKSIAAVAYDRAMIPEAVAFGMQSNVNTYGPWVSMGPPGGIAIEKNDGLVPWEYGGYVPLYQTATGLANDGVTNMQVSEVGSVTVVGYPEIPLGASLNGLSNFNNKNLVENRFLSGSIFNSEDYYYFDYGFIDDGTNGPPITNVTISNQNQVTTQYSFRTFTPKFGSFARINAERLKEINQNKMQNIRDMRNYQNQRSQNLLSNSFSNKSVWQNQIKIYKNKYEKLDKVRKTGTPHEVFIGQILDYGIDKRTIICTSTLNELYQELGRKTFGEKSISSLDSLIRPVSIKGSGKLPRLIQPTSTSTGLGIINQKDLNPYSNPARIDPSGLLTRRYSCDDSGYLGHDIDIISRSNYISGIPGSGFDLSVPKQGMNLFSNEVIQFSGLEQYDTQNVDFYDYKDDYRTFALRGPILLHSWGYDTNGYPVPNYVDTESGVSSGFFESTGLSGSFMSGWLRNPVSWPLAPIDLRLDRERGVWVGTTKVDTVLITGNALAAKWQDNKLTKTSVKCLRLLETSGVLEPSGIITVYNPFATTVTVSANKARIATVIDNTLMNIDCEEIDFTG